VLTCPTTAIFAGLDAGEPIALGRNLRFFGDGWQIAKKIGDQRFWRVPVMDGEFVCQETTPVVKAVGGGNLLLLAHDVDAALGAAAAAVAAMQQVRNVIMPFPGGVVRSGSKVGSKYPALPASTNDAYCPALTALTAKTALTPDIRAVLEIVIDGLTENDVGAAMAAGMNAVTLRGVEAGIARISAGNYGGKLGPYHFHLHELTGSSAGASQ
jgi:formylmethanofuran--tetrahydromethanopterin N-formyltransferase